jgi:triphosphatase
VQPHQECELKLALEPASLATLARSTLLASADTGPRRTRTRTVYFDTPDLALRAQGLSLRIRQDGNEAVQTVKNTGHALLRGEWSMPIAGDAPDPALVPDRRIAQFLSRARIRRALKPVFSVDMERDIWRLGEDGSQVEIVLDSGMIRTDDAEEAVCEAEIELLGGQPASLRAVAQKVGRVVPALLSLASKAERGYRLLESPTPRPSPDCDVDVAEDLSVGAAHRVTALAALRLFLDNLGHIQATGSVDSVHLSRVALRRVRALRSLFRPLLDTTADASIRDDLRWISGCLGALRDLDVFCAEQLAPAAKAHPRAPGFDGLADFLAARRAELLVKARAALASPRFLDLSLALLWEAEGLDRSQAPAEIAAEPLRPFLRAQWDRRLRKLVRAGRDLEEQAPPARHETRIRAKKLRYMIEPFASLTRGKASTRLLARLKALQDTLGALNDRATGEAMLIDLSRQLLDRAGQDAARASEPLFAAGLIAGRGESDPGKARQRALKARDRLADTNPFWEDW